jgi:hypothetical protein
VPSGIVYQSTDALLNSASGGTADNAVAGAQAEALMSEMVALRAILLNVLFKQSNGEQLTAEEMQRLVDRADSDKLRKARERLLQAQESEGQRKKNPDRFLWFRAPSKG